jgi:hypothetical protein
MQPAWTPTIQTWYYLCVERFGTTFRMYVGTAGGSTTMLGKVTNSISIFDATANINVGGEQTTGNTNAMFGNIDELRLTVGVARYNTDAGFLVPTAAFPRS